MIKLVPIDENNFEAVIKLDVHEHQRKFVAPNVHSLAECYLYRKNEDVFPYAVRDGKTIVGFLLLDLDFEEKEMMIWRMMIDKQYQGKGYGRQTVPMTLLARVEQFPSEAITDPGKVSYTIPDFWKKSMESGVMQVLEKHAATSDIYGVCTPISQEKGTFEFGIGVRHDGSEVPVGYQLCKLSSSKWAVFKCIGTEPSSVSETWDRINQEFEKQSGYKMLEETDYEFYPEEKEANVFCELWVPVEKQPN